MIASLPAILVLCGSCSPAYVLRAAYEESRILWRRQDIRRLLEDPQLPAGDRRQLELVLEARAYAAETFGFDVGGSYSSLSRIDDPAVVHVLTAARRDKLEGVTWWYPIVGRVPYRGFFSEEEAGLAALKLEEQGYDTYVRPSVAFSTLGWFDDPLLSNLLRLDAVSLVEIVFHELFHTTLFVPGRMAFNESAAVFAGHRGAIEFFCRHDKLRPEACEAASRRWRDALRVSGFVADVVAEVDRYYDARGEATTESDRRKIFSGLHDRFQTISFETDRYGRLEARVWNNAVLIHERTYFRELDLFEELYQATGSVAGARKHMERIIPDADNPFRTLRKSLPGPSTLTEAEPPRSGRGIVPVHAQAGSPSPAPRATSPQRGEVRDAPLPLGRDRPKAG